MLVALVGAVIICVRGVAAHSNSTDDLTLPRLGDLVPGVSGILNQECKLTLHAHGA